MVGTSNQSVPEIAIDPRDGLAQLTDLALRSLPETRTWLHRHHGADLVNGERKKKTLHQIALYIYIIDGVNFRNFSFKIP